MTGNELMETIECTALVVKCTRAMECAGHWKRLFRWMPQKGPEWVPWKAMNDLVLTLCKKVKCYKCVRLLRRWDVGITIIVPTSLVWWRMFAHFWLQRTTKLLATFLFFNIYNQIQFTLFESGVKCVGSATQPNLPQLIRITGHK